MFKVYTDRSDFNASWITSPGVVHGCEVVKTSLTVLKIKPGVLTTVNGYNVQIKEDMVLTRTIPVPSVGTSRIDFAYVNFDNGHALPVYSIGTEYFNVGNYVSMARKDLSLLALVVVRHPLVVSTDIEVYNVIPNAGEYVFKGVSGIEVPDTNRTDFYFPAARYSNYSMRVTIDNALSQSEGIDYTFVDVIDINGTQATKIRFAEAIPEGASVEADIYTGKASLII